MDIEALAKKAKIYQQDGQFRPYLEALEHFAELVAAEVREACAKVLEDKHSEMAARTYPPPKILMELAAAIRMRSNE